MSTDYLTRGELCERWSITDDVLAEMERLALISATEGRFPLVEILAYEAHGLHTQVIAQVGGPIDAASAPTIFGPATAVEFSAPSDGPKGK